ncbi:MAG: anthranilate synthase component I [Candidatus Omnitrophica bacterium]|nr:anthranilate synthase component I [Candidatus Omnitrophota bacterium]
MITPDFASFKKLAKKGNLVAVQISVPADLETPVSSFLKLASAETNAFLLESAEHAEQVGRYSIIGFKPAAVLSSYHDRIVIQKGNRKARLRTSDHLIEVLESSVQGTKLANPEDLPGFCGGYVGYFGYENVEHFEKVKLQCKKGPKIPDAVFFLTRSFLVFDHFRKTLNFVELVPIEANKSLTALYQGALKKIRVHVRCLRKPLRPKMKMRRPTPIDIRSNMKKKDFEQKVARIREYIRAGDCIQVVLSQRFRMNLPMDDFHIYRALRSINPSPYMFYFRAGTLRMIGSSPELLVRNSTRVAEVRPIAGTRPRGENQAMDQKYEENLRRSPKETAEHLMLVDLGRNDLGRVCEFNTVKVKNYARVERYSHVMHLVSDVVGKLRKGKNCFDLLKATFPAGTVTGAPKIRAMQIIDELEHEKRGAYAGCVGYFDFNRNMEMCITIRTIVVDRRQMYLQAGAGIVKDSQPAREYQETVNKAKALIQAVERQRDF